MTILAFPRPSVRAQLVASFDQIKLGGEMCDAGQAIAEFGDSIRHVGHVVMDSHDPLTERDICEADQMASRAISTLLKIRISLYRMAGHVQLPADCEPVA